VWYGGLFILNILRAGCRVRHYVVTGAARLDETTATPLCYHFYAAFSLNFCAGWAGLPRTRAKTASWLAALALLRARRWRVADMAGRRDRRYPHATFAPLPVRLAQRCSSPCAAG